MRKGLLLTILTGICFSAAAQNVTLTGKVSNAESDSILLQIPDNPFDARTHKTYAALNEKGEFRMTLQLEKPVLADLTNGEDGITLFLQPGDNLELKFSADNVVKTIKFKGQGEAENVYLREQEKKFEENEDYQVLPDNIYMREEQFSKFINAKKEDQEIFLQKYIAKSPLSEAFQKYAKAQIEFTWANDRLTFPDLREKIVFAEKRLTMTPAYFEFLKTLDLNNPAAFISPVYNDFAMNYLHYLATAGNFKKTDQDYFYQLFELAKNKLSGNALNLVQARIIFESCKTGHIGFTDRMLRDFNKSNSNPKFAKLINDTYEANKKFAIGSPAPDFVMTTVSGDTVSLQDFKGKLVYLSFWETNCGLCLMDMPYAQDLAKKMEGRDIVFVNIGMDKDEKAWRNMVTKKQLLGVHAFGKTASEDLKKLYELKENPSYFLIAEDGTFLNTKPKRPSSHGSTDEIAQSFGKAANTATALKK
ncbi:TlpA family protein disulfide reductase [Adhaeribacter terreus]|uniref:TlpA family protein disulfide reductase n=1 Tax=Adhaeribacter terreus TaxID=529703 RepID=A0ABW0EDS1_9BACT